MINRTHIVTLAAFAVAALAPAAQAHVLIDDMLTDNSSSYNASSYLQSSSTQTSLSVMRKAGVNFHANARNAKTAHSAVRPDDRSGARGI